MKANQSRFSTQLYFLLVWAGIFLAASPINFSQASERETTPKRGSQTGEAPAPRNFQTLGEELLKHVKENFFDSQRAARWAKEHAGYAAKISTRKDFARLTNQLLAELKTSHTDYFTPDDLKYYQPEFGVDFIH